MDVGTQVAKEWNRHMQEQEIYLAQRAHQNWITMGDWKTIFQVAVTLRK